MRLVERAQGFDRSWSFGQDGVEVRALLFMPPSAASALWQAAGDLGFAASGQAEFEAALPGADAIGLTLARGGSLRLYLQYWDLMAARVAAGDLSPGPLYLGIKRFADGGARRDVYHCLPMAPEVEYRPEIAAAMARFGAEPEATAALLARLTPETCIWTRTEAPGRRSWLATVRRAGLGGADLARALLPVAARPGVADLLAALGRGASLHIAGGHDARKGDFISFYVEAERPEVESCLRSLGAALTGRVQGRA